MTESEARKGKKRHLPVVPPSPEPLPSYETSYEPAIAIATIRPSPTNPRKRFDDLQDLAASISAQGVIVPIQVRPRPRPDGTLYELVCGERRWRASQLAGLTTIKAEVIDLPDDVVIERQIIENVQRHDVDPLDEAFGFRVLRDAGRDVDYIAAKTGKSRAWVYARLKLCDLSEPIREHLASGKLSPSVALLLARIPDPATQEWAAREVLRLDPQEVKRVLEGEDEGRLFARWRAWPGKPRPTDADLDDVAKALLLEAQLGLADLGPDRERALGLMRELAGAAAKLGASADLARHLAAHRGSGPS